MGELWELLNFIVVIAPVPHHPETLELDPDLAMSRVRVIRVLIRDEPVRIHVRWN